MEKVTHIIGSPAAERKLVSGLVHGDEASYRQLYEVFAPPLRRTLHRLFRESSLTDDTVQATFLIVFRRVESFDFRSGLLTWITRIGIREGVRIARAANRVFDFEPPGSTEESDSPEARAIRAQQGMHLEGLITTLPDAKRVPLLLFELEGFSVEEIAELLGQPRGTILSRLSRTRAELREAIQVFDRVKEGRR